MIDLNKESLSLAEYQNGKKYRIEVKVNNLYYYIDIDKDMNSCLIDIYLMCDKSKYAPECSLRSVWVRNDAIITDSFIQESKEIEKAQRIYDRYRNVLR